MGSPTRTARRKTRLAPGNKLPKARVSDYSIIQDSHPHTKATIVTFRQLLAKLLINICIFLSHFLLKLSDDILFVARCALCMQILNSWEYFLMKMWTRQLAVNRSKQYKS